MTHDVSETCTCGTQLTVRGSFMGQPITFCAHCDTALANQPDHKDGQTTGCRRCYRYDHHALRYPDWRK